MKVNYKDNNCEHDHTQALKPYYAAAIILSSIIVMKTYAYAASGSTSMLASLIDSLGDIIISSFAFLSIRLSLKPADEEHRFGHGKAEGFSALFQACFLCGASIFLILETVHTFLTPTAITNHGLGITVSCSAIILTLILIHLQKRAYRAAPSLALKADQNHYTSDVLLNGAIIVAFIFDMIGILRYTDQAISIGIALYILKTAKDIGQEAIDMLMDKEISETERQKIMDIVNNDSRVHGMHDLRTRKSGMNIYISFDVELEPTLSLEKAHSITRDLDLAILNLFPNAEIIIHKDPIGDTYDPRHRVSGVHFQ